jgi:S-adenosylhomocysteine hydrolase
VSTTKRTADASAAAGIPVVACHAAECVRLADRSIGRRIVQETLRLTNRRMPGTRAAVTGYGATAGSIAATVMALGGTVRVLEPDPVWAFTALLDGHTPGGSTADMVFVCDRGRFDEAALGAGALLVDVDASSEPTGREVRPGVWEHGLGYLVRPRVTRSFEDADLVLSVAALALDHLVTERPGSGVTEVPVTIDTAVAHFAVEVLS